MANDNCIMNGDTSAFVAYLRCEANMAADRAKQLRDMADSFEAGITNQGNKTSQSPTPLGKTLYTFVTKMKRHY